MKIPYKHLVSDISSNPSIEELSDRLFQLGHEHEIYDEIFDMELTPNRGDCLSLRGLQRDLRTFYESDLRWLRHYGFLPIDIPSRHFGIN